MNCERPEEITICSVDHSTSATFIPSRGGIGSSLIMPCGGNSQEMLFLRDNFRTGEENIGGWPFLFPVCGRHMSNGQLRKYQWNGTTYDMPIHGFAMRKSWTVEEQGTDFVVMSLTVDAKTLSCYPFRFYVRLTYTVSSGSIRCDQHYENRGREPMPFYAGFHPYFKLDDADRANWTINGAITATGLYDESFTSITGWNPVAEDVNALLSGNAQRVLMIKSDRPLVLVKNGTHYLKLIANGPVDTAAFPFVQLYRSGEDPFICIEPWMGLPNGLNRPGDVPMIPIGESRQATFVVTT